jgi:DNA-3-methyladenine glycosylase
VNPLNRRFYIRDAAFVARDLLGKVVVRRFEGEFLSGKIVETEAYFGDLDPASRAFKGRKNYNAVMFEQPGRLFVYMVHGWWLLNIVAHLPDKVGAVLIRALEPLEGVEHMEKRREKQDVRKLANGPGKLSQAFAVTKDLNGLDVTLKGSEFFVMEGDGELCKISTSSRVGVTKDLSRNLRFYIWDSEYTSR